MSVKRRLRNSDVEFAKNQESKKRSQHMKRFIVLTLATATVGFLAAGAAFAADDIAVNTGTFDSAADSIAAYTVNMAANGIEATRHNVGGTGNYIAVRADVNAAGSGLVGDAAAIASNSGGRRGEGGGSSEICVFCHTPHHTVSSSNPLANFAQGYGEAPLWNRRGTIAAASYVTYGTTIGGTNVGAPSGVTLACLSCHDGATAMDNLVNGPGENALSGRLGGVYGDANSQGFLFADVFDGSITPFQIGYEERLNIGNGNPNGLGADPFNSLPAGTGDLSNDHPMSVVYSDGSGVGGSDLVKRASLRDRTTTISTIDLASGLYFTTSTAYGNEMLANLTQNLWADKGFISDTAMISDMLRGGKVECSSCHDPHFKNLSNADLVNNVTVGERIDDDSAGYAATVAAGAALPTAGPNAFARATTFAKQDGLFLRRVGGNAGSGVCRTCHNK